MKSILITLQAILIMGFVNAQSYGEIQGKLKDSSGEPIMFASVWVEQGSKTTSTTSDVDGRFKIKPLNSGSYTVNASHLGHQNIKVIDVGVNPDQITFVKDIVMDEVTMSGTGDQVAKIIGHPIPLINPEETSVITVNMDDFKLSPASKNLSTIISVIAPGVKPQGDGGLELSFKGSRTGANAVYLDGMKIMGGTVPRIPSSGVKRVSVYTGGVPAKYGDATGGIVVIETKDYFSEYNKRKYSK